MKAWQERLLYIGVAVADVAPFVIIGYVIVRMVGR